MQAAEEDAAFLEEHGYVLQWLRRDPLIYTVLAERAGETTKLEWVVDSDFRFFPTIPDETFGYVLHPADLATNKVAAAYGRREPRYTEADFRRVDSDPPIDPAATMKRLREILSEAETFVTRMPTGQAGLLFLKDGHVVQPDPARLEDYQTHAGQRRGQWPTSAEISSAMLDRYKTPPTP